MKREIACLRKERRKLKKLKNQFASDCNKVGVTAIELATLQKDLTEWKKKLQNHLAGTVLLGSSESEFKSILAKCEKDIVSHSQV